MLFILGPNKFPNLKQLRQKYQDEKNINLNASQSFFTMPTSLGGVDLLVRKEQIEFMEKILFILKPNLFNANDIKTDQELESSLNSARTVLAASLYLKSQINSKRRSVLYRLLDDMLGINETNYLDEEDQETCCLKAREVITSEFFLEHANDSLRGSEIPNLSEKEWTNFKDFLTSKVATKKTPDSYSHYPITHVTQKLCGAAGAYTGATIGILSGELISSSTRVFSSQMQLTTLIGGTILIFQSAGPAGVALFAPAIAERLIGTFCSISLAYILGTSMRLLGQGVGIGIGMPLDLSYQLLHATCRMAGSYISSSPETLMSGLRISDGMTVLNGIALEARSIDNVPPEFKIMTVDIREDKLYINGQLIDDTELKLPEETLELLKEKLNTSRSQEVEVERVGACI